MVASSDATAAGVAALLDAGADPNARDNFRSTPLHFAAGSSKPPAVVSALLDAGADPYATDQYGDTPWDVLPENSPLRGTDAYRRLNDARVQ